MRALVPVPVVASTLLWALDSGLLSMLAVGIPFVLTFYLVIAALEDSGYLASTAVLSDRIFNALGLPGRAAIPLLAATGCNVPAIYATRVLDSRRERLLASFLVSLTPCSASSAVIVAALSPYVGMGAALGAFGVIAAVAIVAGLGANAILPGRQSPLVLELPPLRLPIPRQVVAKAWHRFRSFVTTATPVMLGGSLADRRAVRDRVRSSPIEAALAPVSTGLLGLPSVAGIALVLAVLRKELALQLLLTLAIAQFGLGARSLISFMTPGQLFVFAVVTGLSVPCVATIGALVGEFGWRARAGRQRRDAGHRARNRRGRRAAGRRRLAAVRSDPAGVPARRNGRLGRPDVAHTCGRAAVDWSDDGVPATPARRRSVTRCCRPTPARAIPRPMTRMSERTSWSCSGASRRGSSDLAQRQLRYATTPGSRRRRAASVAPRIATPAADVGRDRWAASGPALTRSCNGNCGLDGAAAGRRRLCLTGSRKGGDHGGPEHEEAQLPGQVAVRTARGAQVPDARQGARPQREGPRRPAGEKGNLTAAEERKIDRKADRVLDR